MVDHCPVEYQTAHSTKMTPRSVTVFLALYFLSQHVAITLIDTSLDQWPAHTWNYDFIIPNSVKFNTVNLSRRKVFLFLFHFGFFLTCWLFLVSYQIIPCCFDIYMQHLSVLSWLGFLKTIQVFLQVGNNLSWLKLQFLWILCREKKKKGTKEKHFGQWLVTPGQKQNSLEWSS